MKKYFIKMFKYKAHQKKIIIKNEFIVFVNLHTKSFRSKNFDNIEKQNFLKIFF